jgi:hypothetical protein
MLGEVLKLVDRCLQWNGATCWNASIPSFLVSLFYHVIISSNEDVDEDCGQSCKRTHFNPSKCLQRIRTMRTVDDI